MSTITNDQVEAPDRELSQAADTVARRARRRAAGGSDYLPVRPLRRWLRDYVIRAGGTTNAARELHQHERQLKRILREHSRVTVAVADAILIAAGEPHTFAILYPVDEEMGVGEHAGLIEGSGTVGGVCLFDRWCRWCRDEVRTDDVARCPRCHRPTRPLDEVEVVLAPEPPARPRVYTRWCRSCQEGTRSTRCSRCGRRTAKVAKAEAEKVGI